MFTARVINRHGSSRSTRVTATLLSLTHFILAVAIALTALFGSYAGGDWTWWLTRASAQKLR